MFLEKKKRNEIYTFHTEVCTSPYYLLNDCSAVNSFLSVKKNDMHTMRQFCLLSFPIPVFI